MYDLGKKNKSVKYFVFLAIMPLAAIVVMFSYALFHIQKDLDFVHNEIVGLDAITKITDIVFDIQKLRGLTCIANPNSGSAEAIEFLKESISKDLAVLKQKLFYIKNSSSLRYELLDYIESIDKSSLEYANFDYLSKLISDFMMFSYRISYLSKLILDPEPYSYILVINAVSYLPELIEYNGQIRAIASSAEEELLSAEKKQSIRVQINKIEEKVEFVKYNMEMLSDYMNDKKIKIVYEKMLEAQERIFNLTNNHLLNSEKLPFMPDELNSLATRNIELIIDLYRENSKLLDNILEKKYDYSNRLMLHIVIAEFLSILFILFVNILFYNKNKKFVEKIEKLTITDSLTSLYNRRYFDLIFDNLLKTQKRTGQTLVFIILDIDFFKQYNDTYGHLAGDEALRRVASCLNGSLKRDGDLAFRLGGEEFGVLCSGLDNSQAFDFANSIRKCVEDENIEHKNSLASQHVTISMGLVVVEPEFVNSVNDIYRYADEALYKAKDNGRNQVSVYFFCNK
ncbi:GGDEF domain-containing protein [Sulfurimonas sp.]|uniref:GGDEF domain-containing protein n=1 Tax=Sulfurimonas sp. TaxID=2022749 RepID=UPI0025F20A31|nr:GGDEF domain-containing protein [Sulfurimonas sp.]MBW6488592.1 GGDEF domain-containing protein [Sulfurimonas sp.]